MLPKPTDPMETKTTPVHPLVSDERIEVEADDQGYAVMTPEQVARHGTDRSERGQRHRVAFTHGLRRGRTIYEADRASLAAENALLAEQVKAATLLLAMAQTWLLSHQDRPERALDSIEDFLTSLTPSSK